MKVSHTSSKPEKTAFPNVAKRMDVNDISPETDQIDGPEIAEEGQDNELNDIDDDIHVCRKCNLEFCGIQKYLEHKIKHDNFRVKYGRSEVDKRMIMPKLVQKSRKKPLQETVKVPVVLEEEKENELTKRKGKRGRKRASEIHDQGLVITEKPVYSCEKCHKTFNREATLRRHIQYDHNEDDLEDEDEENLDDDRDRDYKPSKIEIEEEEMKDQAEEESAEMDSLDQVIMAAEMMEKAEELALVSQTVSITTDSGQVISATISKQQADDQSTFETGSIQENGDFVASPLKRQKLSEEEKALRKYSCFLCGNKFKDANVLKSHMITHSTKREFVCTYGDCPYSFKTKGSWKRHLRRHTGERPYPCELCGRNFAESGALTRHLKSRTPCTSKSDNDLPRYGKKWTYTPNIPAVNMSKKPSSKKARNPDGQTNNGNLKKDSMIQEVSEEVTLPVNDSGAMTSVVQVLDETLHEEQGEEYYNIDDDGGVEIVITGTDDVISDDSIGQFVQNETDITDSVSNVCRVCGEDLASIEALKIHLRTHLADQACRCWMCHFNTENKETFENHMLMHHHVQIKNSDPLLDLMPLEPDIKDSMGDSKDKEKRDTHKDAQIAVKQLMEIPDEAKSQHDTESGTRLLYKCPICMRRFRGSNYLKLHMRNHTGLRPHKCGECDKSFITKDTLNKHMSSHEDERNFKCGECGKLFKRLSHVREHLKIHTGLRPYPCTVCSKTFKTNNAMKVHLRTHSDILPYECTFCHRRFREKGSVLRHTRMHTGEKPYECMYCGRSFAEHGTLNRHLKAKVSCTKQLQQLRDKHVDGDDDTDYTVLAQFSSVVADTQQYIIQEGEEVDSEQIQETLVQDNLLETDNELQLDQTNQETEYVLVETGEEEEEVQNLEIVTSEEGQAIIEGVQVSEDYIMIAEEGGSQMKIMDSKTGQIIAIVPVMTSGESGSEIHTITLPQEGVVSAESLDTEIDVPTETVTSIVEYMDPSSDTDGVAVDESQEPQESVET